MQTIVDIIKTVAFSKPDGSDKQCEPCTNAHITEHTGADSKESKELKLLQETVYGEHFRSDRCGLRPQLITL